MSFLREAVVLEGLGLVEVARRVPFADEHLSGGLEPVRPSDKEALAMAGRSNFRSDLQFVTRRG